MARKKRTGETAGDDDTEGSEMQQGNAGRGRSSQPPSVQQGGGYQGGMGLGAPSEGRPGGYGPSSGMQPQQPYGAPTGYQGRGRGGPSQQGGASQPWRGPHQQGGPPQQWRGPPQLGGTPQPGGAPQQGGIVQPGSLPQQWRGPPQQGGTPQPGGASQQWRGPPQLGGTPLPGGEPQQWRGPPQQGGMPQPVGVRMVAPQQGGVRMVAPQQGGPRMVAPQQGGAPQLRGPPQLVGQRMVASQQGWVPQWRGPTQEGVHPALGVRVGYNSSHGEASSRPELHQAPSHSPPSAVTLTEVVTPELALTQQIQQLSIEQQSVSSHASQAVQPIPQSSKSIKFPSRPGNGSRGTKCIVKANHFIAALPNKDLHQYDVSIIPEVTSRGVNRAVIKELVALHRASQLGNRLPAYDGRKSLYTAGPLPFSSKEFLISLENEDEGPSGKRRVREFKVVIKMSGRADLHHLGQFLKGRQSDAPQEALQVLDIVLRELPTARYTPVGRSFYSPHLGKPQTLGDGLESWRGFYQSIRPTQMGLSLNIDMSSTAFFEPQPVIDFVCILLNRDIRIRPLSDSDRIKVKKALRGVKVEVTHRGNMRRKYKIVGLTVQATRDLAFPVDNDTGTKKFVMDYFYEQYGFTIQNAQLPCLQVGNLNKPNYLPMEVCKIAEGQRYSKRLNEKQITALLKMTCLRPSDRENDIVSTVRQNDYKNDEYAKEFGLEISNSLAHVEARVLPPPRLKYHDTGREKDCVPQVGQWNMMNKKLVNGGNVHSWMCINFSRQTDQNASKFCYELAQMCNVSGMSFNPDPVLPLVTARPELVERVLKGRYHDVMAVLGPQKRELDLLIAILPDSNGSLYGDLKRICETELGIVSQCCLNKHVQKMNRQYFANVCLKINVKVGGRNTVLTDALSRRIPLVSDRPTIIFGADVTHPHPGEDSSPSIAAVVASQDWPEVTKYAGLVSAQAHRQELIQDLYKETQDPVRGTVTGGMIKDLLISFKKSTGYKPQRIIFYRDGVSEGQFYQVLFFELDAIRKACASLEPNYQPPVTFVVVQKRHHTRLFPNNPNDRSSVDRSGNILPGTVVDTKICHPTEFDFYLCSHAGIQGTSRPAHYHVLWDENKFTADGLHSLTNNLCYTYARCTRSVSIVPPAYYAHLAAFRARFYMEPESNENESTIGGPIATGGKTIRGVNAGPSVVKPLPALRENVKRVMFYC